MLSTIVRGQTTSASFGFDPARQVRIGSAREFDQGAVQNLPVVRQVVAAEYGERRHALRTAAAQRFDQPADRAARPRWIGEIVHDVRIGRIQRVARVEAITLFRHGQ
jgi:hypothetical protein